MFTWRVLVVSVDSEGSLRGGGLCIISMDVFRAKQEFAQSRNPYFGAQSKDCAPYSGLRT